jgi:hypothetical protein
MIKIIINYQQSDITIDIEETKTFTDIQDILENRTGIGLLGLYDINTPVLQDFLKSYNIINMDIPINQLYPDTLIINLIALLPYFELTDELINICRIKKKHELDLKKLKDLSPKIPFERYIWTYVTNYDYLFAHNNTLYTNDTDLLLPKKYKNEIESTFYLFDTSNGTSFRQTFFNSTYKLNGVMNWNLTKGTDFTAMFAYSKNKGHNIIDDPINLNKLIIPNNEEVRLKSMFEHTHIKSSISEWDISKVRCIYRMCYSTKIELPLLINKEL